MGYFSNLDLTQRTALGSKADRSYPTPIEKLQWYLEDLTEMLDRRGVSVEQLAQITPNGLVDYFEPGADCHYWQIEDDSTTKELILAVGEVAVHIQEEHHYELIRELQKMREPLLENSAVELKLSA